MNDDSTPPMWSRPETGAPRPRALQRLVAVPWRHPGLIVLCALAGTVAAAALSPRHPALPPVAARVQVERTPPAVDGAAPAAVLAGASRAEDMAALLDRAPPAGSAAGLRRRGAVVVPGLVAGLFLGLLAAAARELRGDRMRSAREAERALGVPVLGAVPTLSARARGALLTAARR